MKICAKIITLCLLTAILVACANGKTHMPPPLSENQTPGMQSYDYMYRSPPPPVAAALARGR